MVTIPLTKREAEVAELRAMGYSNGFIARQLFLSVRTVETHIGRIHGKLGVTCQDELIELYRT